MPVANSSSAEQDHFDLLPFIAIMMCLLGTLLLVTMSMAAINIGAGAAEGWVPEPDLTPGAKAPVLIEWDGKQAVWHSGKGLQRVNDLDPFLDYLASHRSSEYALFAVRPSGFASFRRFAAKFEDRGIEIGSEPIEQGKSVRLVKPPGGAK